MRRLLVVDDERPVVDSVSLIVRRDLAGEFEAVGTAASGREAIGKAAALSPDIILMDVRMPGISGLDAIREIKKRGSNALFILMTAYERFDIAREAVELGVLDYLLKPVTKDKLAGALRAAASYLERRGELERREIEHREREERTREFVETALLHGIMLGERFGPELAKYRACLGIEESFVVALAAAFLPLGGSPDPEAEARALHERLRALLRYKTRALAGPLVSGLSLALLPLKDERDAASEVRALRDLVEQECASSLEKGLVRLGVGGARRLEDASQSWVGALAELLGSPGAGAEPTPERTPAKRFEEDEAFLERVIEGSPERSHLALELILEPLAERAGIEARDRYRVISLFGSAYRLLVRRGQLDPAQAEGMLDLEDLRSAPSGGQFAMAARGRFSRLAEALASAPRWSAPLAKAMAYLRENYGTQMTLETAAEFSGVSASRLSRLFAEEAGRGFLDCLTEYRIERAKELLTTPGATIKQVSSACGYPDPNYFSRLFKKVTGCTPTAFSSGAAEEDDA